MQEFKILLVEQDRQWENILKEKIQYALDNPAVFNYRLKTVQTYDEAHKVLCEEQPWHLLITDIKLGRPDKKGVFLLDYAHQMNVLAIAVSGALLGRRELSDLYMDYHIYGFFTKREFDRNKFISKVREAFQKFIEIPARYISSESSENDPKVLEVKCMPYTYALLVGVANYHHINSLSKTTNDARDFCDLLLKNACSLQNIRLLLDDEATKAAINKNLDWLARHVETKDTVIIFFSGHGMQFVGGFSPGEYLCPVEAAIDQAKDTCISSEEFANALRAIKADRLVVLLDSCHSGGVGQPKDPDLQVKVGLTDTTYSNFSKGKGRVIIASCKPDEVSWELPEMSNGLFTHYLLKGLYGEAAQSDRTVSYIDLFGYISRNVPLHKPQHPFLKSEAENFVIFTTQRLDSNIRSSSLSSSSSSSQERQSISITTDVTKLRKAMLEVYDRPSFEIFCTDIGLNYDHLRGDNLEAKIMYLIEDFKHRRNLEQLVVKVLAEHSYLESDIR
jgi:hypothetical protein